MLFQEYSWEALMSSPSRLWEINHGSIALNCSLNGRDGELVHWQRYRSLEETHPSCRVSDSLLIVHWRLNIWCLISFLIISFVAYSHVLCGIQIKRKFFLTINSKQRFAIYCLIIMRTTTLVFVSYPNIHCWPTFGNLNF